MSIKSNDMQREMFNEFKDKQTKNKKNVLNNNDNSLFNIEFLKDIRIEFSLDILLILGIVFILFSLTMYFFGIQRGKSVKDSKLIYENNQLQQVIRDKDNTVPIILSKKDYLKYKKTSNVKKKTVKIKKEIKPKIIKTIKNKKIDKIELIKKVEPKKNKTGINAKYKYTIQVGASRNEEAAIKDIQELSEKGYKAFLTCSTSSSGKKWYKICVGKFKKSSEASLLVRKLKSKESFADCFLTHM